MLIDTELAHLAALDLSYLSSSCDSKCIID